jgi:hypothetical protein
MDEKTIIYLVLGILYFLFQLWNDSKKKAQKQVEQVPTYTENKPRSLADLLREIERKTTVSTATTPPPVVAEKPMRSNKQKKLAEKQNVFYQEKNQKYSPIETVQSKSGRFDVFDQHEKANKYATMLKNPSNVKQAIIMNEILKRKY